MSVQALKIVLDRPTIENFRGWLNLNVASITWENKYREQFEHFWSTVFEPGIEVADALERLNFCVKQLHTGPLVAWVKWLRGRVYCFLFTHYPVSLHELAVACEERIEELSLILREFYVDRLPHLEDELNQAFHISPDGRQYSLRHEALHAQLGQADHAPFRGSMDDEVMPSLELTLYPEWDGFLISLAKMYQRGDFSGERFDKRVRRGKVVQYLKEATLFFVIGGLLVMAVKYGNQVYEGRLLGQIEILEPNFFWLDKKLTYKPADKGVQQEIELAEDELDVLDQSGDLNFRREERVGPESEVVVTSLEQLPRSIDLADQELSEYEEGAKGGFRYSRFGRGKAYRIMMNSARPSGLRSDLLAKLRQHDFQQSDNVRPGTEIPGGMYFNVYIPYIQLRDFIESMKGLGEATVYESRTREVAPKGMSKVFIWVKQL